MFVFLLLFIALPPAQAGEIHGRVLNQDGGAVPAARVTVESEDGRFYRDVRARTVLQDWSPKDERHHE